MGGIETKKKYCLALVILLIAYTGFANLAVGYKPIITPNTDYRSTYTPNSNYDSYIPPTQLGSSNNQQSIQLSPSTIIKTNLTNATIALPSELVKEEFRIVGDSNEPIPNAQVAGLDGSSNRFLEYTDDSGYVTISGTTGIWQFTVYASGYFNKLVNHKVEDNNDAMLIKLQKIVPEKINQTGNRFLWTNTVYKEATNKTVSDWLCELNEYSEKDGHSTPDKSSTIGAKG